MILSFHFPTSLAFLQWIMARPVMMNAVPYKTGMNKPTMSAAMIPAPANMRKPHMRDMHEI